MKYGETFRGEHPALYTSFCEDYTAKEENAFILAGWQNCPFENHQGLI